MNKQSYNTIIIGAGASGLLCALKAAEGGRKVLLIDHQARPGQKIMNFFESLELTYVWNNDNIYDFGAKQMISVNSESAILPLIEGYKRFRERYFEDTKSFDDLVQHGQKPNVLVVACCDSRVDPAIVTNCLPGELFVVRNVANLVPPFDGNQKHHGTSAALEFGVLHLGVSDIIVFGHSHCGGIHALMEKQENGDKSDFISAWMDIARPAKQRVLAQHPKCSFDEQAHYCEKESLLISLDNLSTFPWIRERVLEKRLFLHAWYFDLVSGMIETYTRRTSNIGEFVSLG